MPLMKVRNEANDAWHTVDHLNFECLGIGLNEAVVIKKGADTAKSGLNKIYAYDNPYDENPVVEEIMYKSSTQKLIEENATVKEINTEMNSDEQKAKYDELVNTATNKERKPTNVFLIEHRKLTDKNETFHVLHFWNGEKWIPLNNIWG